MRTKLLLALLIGFITILFTGCPPQEVKKAEPPPPTVQTPPPAEFNKTGSADMFFRAASIDLKAYTKKIEKDAVKQFASRIKKEKIDILAVQTIVRYPGLKERIDVYEEIAKQTEMYKAFGETIALSGRQTGNGLYSTYPIRSHDVVEYKNLKSLAFESALVGLIDAGTRPLLAVSTRIPDKSSEKDVMYCLKSIALQKLNFKDTPIAIFGNIFQPANMQLIEGMDQPVEYNVVKWKQGGDSQKFPFWFSSGDLQVQSSNIIETDLGLVLIVEFKLAGQSVK